MDEITAGVNWIAVIVGAVAAFMLGWLWYSPKLFGTRWAEGVGVSLTDSSGPSGVAMVAQAVGTFLLAWVVGVTAAMNALFTIGLVILTIMLLMIAGGKFSNKSNYAIATEVGFVVAMAVIMILCQALL